MPDDYSLPGGERDVLATRIKPGGFYTGPYLIKFPGSAFSQYLVLLSAGFTYAGAHVGDPAALAVGTPPAERRVVPADVGWGPITERIEPVLIRNLAPTLQVRGSVRGAALNLTESQTGDIVLFRGTFAFSGVCACVYVRTCVRASDQA